jgi:hypothetical protein
MKAEGRLNEAALLEFAERRLYEQMVVALAALCSARIDLIVSLIGGAAAGWPLAARAQQPTMPVIGFLHAGSKQQNVEPLAAYRKGLREAGFSDGENVEVLIHAHH